MILKCISVYVVVVFFFYRVCCYTPLTHHCCLTDSKSFVMKVIGT
ncbi:unnamed protein product [Brassica rapa subsp. trilocularis]